MVASVPAGQVTSYGDVSAVLQALGIPCTARRVARTLSQFGGQVPWWRVVRADGGLAQPVAAPAARRLREEGIPVERERVPLARLRWRPDLDELSRLLG